MNGIKKYTPSFFAALLLCIALFVLYPYYGYYLEADAIGYLTVAERYAAGDIGKAINGYWSPFSCWLVAAAIKMGFVPMNATIIINGVAAIGFIFISQSYFLKFQLGRLMQWMLNGALVLFLCYAVYLQWFADLWMCFFMLCTLRLMISDKFSKSLYWIACGFTAGLAYLSKAYALPFFIMMAAVFIIISLKRNDDRKRITGILVSLAIAGVMAFCWVWQLHGKYDVWTISTAGDFNSAWAVNGKQQWADEYKYLVPPVYEDSPYLWEDPYMVAKIESYRGSDVSFITSQVARIGMNLIKNISNMNAISFVFMFSVLVAAGVAFSRKVRDAFPEGAELVAWAMLLFPVGYLLVMPREVTEPRFFWCLVPLTMVFTGMVLQKAIALVEKRALRLVVMSLFAISYVCTPVMGMKEIFKDGAEDNSVVKDLNAAGIAGTFTSNAEPGAEKLTVIRAAYLSKNLHYFHPVNSPSWKELLAEMRMRKVKYYFHFSREAEREGYILYDEQGSPLPEVQVRGIDNFRIFLVQPQ